MCWSWTTCQLLLFPDLISVSFLLVWLQPRKWLLPGRSHLILLLSRLGFLLFWTLCIWSPPHQWCQWADSWLLALCCCFFERHVTLLLLALLFLCSWLSSSPYLVLCLRVFFIIDNVWRAPSTRSPVLGYVRCLSSIITIIIIIVIKKLITKNMSESYLDGYDKHQASCPGSQYWTGHRVLQTGL